MRLQQRQFESFESQLDIRNLVGMQTNLKLLLDILLNREQLILFRNQHERTAVFKDMSSSDDQQDTVQSAKNDSDDEDEIGQERPPKSAKRSKKKKGAKFDDFTVLRGYHIGNDIDRRLLKGMFEPEED